MPDQLTIFIYDYVGHWDDEVRAIDVVQALAEYGSVDEVLVRLNSPGGEVDQGIAIYNALASHRARVTTQVDGLAASIASVILQAGDERLAQTGSAIMIHEPSQWTGGTASQLETSAEMLRGLTGQLADIYAARSGTGREAWVDRLEAGDTWYDTDGALAAGLIDRVVEPKPVPDGATEQTVFARLLRRTAGADQQPGRPALTASASQRPPRFKLIRPQANLIVSASGATLQPTPPAMSFLERVRNALGLPVTATEDEITAAAEAARASETTDDPAPDPDPEPDAPDPSPDPTPDPDPAPQPTGDDVTARLDRFERAERARIINAAVGDFRIGESERADWDRRLTNDFDAESAALAALPKDRVNPGARASAPKAPPAGASSGTGTRTRAQLRAAARDAAKSNL